MSPSTTRNMRRSPRDGTIAAAITGVLAGAIFWAPSAAAATEPTTMSPGRAHQAPAFYRDDAGFRSGIGAVSWTASSQMNKDVDEQCRSGQSHATFNYSGNYLLRIKLGYGHKGDYPDWDAFWNGPKNWAGTLLKPDQISHEGDVHGADADVLGNGQSNVGTFGLAVYDRDTKERLSWGIWEYAILCGSDHTFNFTDGISPA